jgi:hypothetical protein
VKEELDVIFSLLNEKKHLVVLDCKSINYPSQISESALTPIVVYIKIIPKVGSTITLHPGDLDTWKSTGTSCQIEIHFMIKTTEYLL